MEWIFVTAVLLLFVYHRTFRLVTVSLGLLGVLALSLVALLYWMFSLPYNPEAFISTPVALFMGFCMLVLVAAHGVVHCLSQPETPTGLQRLPETPTGLQRLPETPGAVEIHPPLPRIGHDSLADYVAYRKAYGLPYNNPSMWSDGS